MTGDQILADRKRDTEHLWEKRVVAYKDWLIKEKKASSYTATSAAMTARSFFSYHYLPLQYRTAERRKLRERVRKRQDYQFTREDLKKICDVGDLTERYVVTVGKSFGLRAGDFMRLQRGDLEPYLNREAPIAIGEIATEKESVKAFPLIDSDALPVIRLVIERMTREGRTKPTDPIIDYKRERQLSRILQRLVEKAGINVGNKQVRFHCLRKFLIDRLSSVMSESKWKQIIGKQIDEKAYVSTDSLRDDYKRAMVDTCFQKEATGEEVALLAKKEALKIFAKAQGYKDEDLRKIFLRKNVSNPADEVQILEELAKKKKDEDCPDGEHCPEFSQIPEAQLLTHLKDGWEIIKELSNGEVIVKRIR